MGTWSVGSAQTPRKGRKTKQAQKAEAKKISDLIDEQLKMTAPKVTASARVLVLGQSGVAKSTMIQNFCRHYAPSFWEAEAANWRLKSQLNATRSVISVIETLQAEIDHEDENLRPVVRQTLTEDTASRTPSESGITSEPLPVQVDKSAAQSELDPILPTNAMEHYATLRASTESLHQLASHLQTKIISLPSSKNTGSAISNGDVVNSQKIAVLRDCLDAARALWSCEAVKDLMTTVSHRQLDESAVYCLDNLDRISQVNFEPTDEDMIRACPRNAAIQEYRVKLELSQVTNASNTVRECLFYDIGGMRRLRKVWMTYLDNLDAVVFSISCFDEYLKDQPTVNRLEDTLNLWSSISRSNLLDQARTFLFLTDIGLLEKKLAAGVLFKKYMPSSELESLPNEAPSVIKYLRGAFTKTGPRIGRLQIFEIPDSNSDTISVVLREAILDSTRRA